MLFYVIDDDDVLCILLYVRCCCQCCDCFCWFKFWTPVVKLLLLYSWFEGTVVAVIFDFEMSVVVTSIEMLFHFFHAFEGCCCCCFTIAVFQVWRCYCCFAVVVDVVTFKVRRCCNCSCCCCKYYTLGLKVFRVF